MKDFIKERIEKLQCILKEDQAFLVTSVPNRFYLTRFDTSDGLVVITNRHAWFLTDFRYIETARRRVSSCDVVLSRGFIRDGLALLADDHIHTIFIETHEVSLKGYALIRKALEEGKSNIQIAQDELLDVTLKEMRSVKSRQEKALICEAQAMTDETFQYILERIEVGRREKDVMLDMEFYIRKLGSEGVAFDFIVVSGPNSSLPHGVPTERRIERGDFVTMDFGAVVKGYRSDMTRTVAMGEVTDEQRSLYEVVRKAQTEAVRAVRPGVPCKEIDKIARDIIDDAGYEGCFGHGLGHSVGIEIHEMPVFNTRCETLTSPGMIITVEPGIYLDGKYGVRIEDMIMVTEDGCENLTHSPRELILL